MIEYELVRSKRKTLAVQVTREGRGDRSCAAAAGKIPY